MGNVHETLSDALTRNDDAKNENHENNHKSVQKNIISHSQKVIIVVAVMLIGNGTNSL